ncbi:MAG: thiamine phosphate synthase [Clostridium sp.]|nr:thiamine phosphate synthase [Clostridium sp.]
MIISMYDGGIYRHLIAVTDRKLCAGDFTEQVGKIASLHPAGLILREKDLSDEEYTTMAFCIQEICRRENVPFFVHGRLSSARQIGCRNLHLPLQTLQQLGGKPADIDILSVSCHSREDVMQAEKQGADRIILGTIYETGCKPHLAGKGASFVREICRETPLPVYAIGGIKPSNLREVMDAGAAGGCMMSGFMTL